MEMFSAKPFWRTKGAGNIVMMEMYAFPNGWGVVVIARVAEGLLEMMGDVVITEPSAGDPTDKSDRENVGHPGRAHELVPVPGEDPYTEHGYDEHGFAQWDNLEALREFMSRVAALPTHRLVGT